MKRLMFLVIVAAFVVLALPGCTGKSKSITSQDLMHHNFVLMELDGKPYKGEKEINISFNEGMRVSGAICNQFMGTAELAENKLVVKQMASTKMLCFEELNQMETDISFMLINGADINYDGQILILEGDGHKAVYKLRDYVN